MTAHVFSRIYKNRRRALVCAALFLAGTWYGNQATAQMKVGNNPTTIDASSMLEVEATNQGILLPRISIGNIVTWGLAGATPVNGMFVYNTNAATTGGSGIGIYYWANAKWNYVQNGPNVAWLLTGNAGTAPGTYAAPGTNFLGTTDNVDFALRTANAERLRIGATGQVGINQNFSTTQQLAVSTAVAANTAILGQNTTASGTGGNGIGVEGISAQAYNSGTGTNGYGVAALNRHTSGTGFYAGGNNVGLNYNFLVNGSGAAFVGTNAGAFGYSEGSSGFGLYGNNIGATGFGVIGESDGAYGIGVYGLNDNTTAFQMGVYGEYNTGGFGTGVIGIGYNGLIPGSGSTIDVGVFGSANDYGVYGYSNNDGIGVYGYDSNDGNGVEGVNANAGIGVVGVNDGTGRAIYGENTGTGDGIVGEVGGAANAFAVWGINNHTSGTGVVGVGNNLAASSYLTNGSGGAFTGSSTGAVGFIPTAANGGTIGTSYSTGSYGLFGRASYYRTANNNNDVYQFGVYGEKQTRVNTSGYAFDKRSGGVLGTLFDVSNSTIPAWGSLGYKLSGNNTLVYGVYGSAAYVSGPGFTSQEPSGFGMGIYGGLMGGWVRGEVYGMNIKGKRYGLYVDGYSYSNKPAVQLIDNGTAQRTVAYSVSSLSADVYAHGKGQLLNGKAQINFDNAFQQIIDANDLVITVTPVGECNGIHLVATDGKGFSVQENKNADQSLGSSNTAFTWIAIAKRKDVQSSDIAQEILSRDYDKNMNDVMFNENDLAHNAGGMELKNGQLLFYPAEKNTDPGAGKENFRQMATKKLDSLGRITNLKNNKDKMIPVKPKALPDTLKTKLEAEAKEEKAPVNKRKN